MMGPVSGTARRRLLLVTGSSGLIGSEICTHFAAEGYEVHGLDNNQRAVFFGPAGDTRWNQARLEREVRGFVNDRRLLFRLRVGGVSRRPTGRLTCEPGAGWDGRTAAWRTARGER